MPSTRRKGSTDAFTIIELMIVMMLIGLFLGLGAGVYVGLGDSLQYRTAIGRVKTVLRKTRNFSVSGGGPAVVYFDAKKGTVRGTGNEPVGMWHFEDERGAYGRDAVLTSGEIVPEGRYGRGLRFQTGGHAELGTSPLFDDPQGFFAEVHVRPLERVRATFLEKGRAYRVGMNSEGRLDGTISTGLGEELSIVAENDEPIPVERWTRVGILYDRFRFQLVRDGRVVASIDETAPLASDRGAPLTVGSRRERFRGFADEARIYRMLSGEEVLFPEGMKLESGPTMLVYRTGGALDPEVHKGPETIRFRLPDRVTDLTVGILGMILETRDRDLSEVPVPPTRPGADDDEPSSRQQP